MEEKTLEKRNLLRKIFKKLIKKVTNKNLHFLCRECKTILFTNNEIVGLYVHEVNKFNIILDPALSGDNFSITKSYQLQYKDNKLEQTDCIYDACLCKNCRKNIIGTYVFASTPEKEFLLEKIIIFHEEIITFNIDEYECYEISLNDEKESQENLNEFSEMNSLNTKMLSSISYILQQSEEIKDFLQLKIYLSNSFEHTNTLLQLSKYVNFLKLK